MSMQTLGDPGLANYWDNEKSKATYIYPVLKDAKTDPKLWQDIAPDDLRQIGPFMVAGSKETHVGRFLHAVDFLVLDHNLVIAARAGRVTEIVERNFEWGDGEKFCDKLNYITLEHDNGEFTQYCHLIHNSVGAMGLKVGHLVRLGEAIGRVGKTGWTDRDHLHFIVFRLDDNPFGFKSLVPRWEEDQ